MTKKWNNLLTLLNTFSEVKFSNNSNYRNKLSKTWDKCSSESNSLCIKIVSYFANVFNNNDLLNVYNTLMEIKDNIVVIDIRKELLLIRENDFEVSDEYLLSISNYLLNDDIIIKQKINPIEISLTIEAIESCFNNSNSSVNKLLDALYIAYETSLINLRTILNNEKTLIIYNSNISMSNEYKNSHSSSHYAAKIASEIIKSTDVDIIKFNETASYIFVNKNKNVLELKKDVQKAKLDCDTIQSAWDLATLTKQHYKRVFILTCGNYCKNTSIFSYEPYLKDLGNPYVYKIDLGDNKIESVNFIKSKLKYSFGYNFNIYDEIQSFEFEITNKTWELINNIKLE